MTAGGYFGGVSKAEAKTVKTCQTLTRSSMMEAASLLNQIKCVNIPRTFPQFLCCLQPDGTDPTGFRV